MPAINISIPNNNLKRWTFTQDFGSSAPGPDGSGMISLGKSNSEYSFNGDSWTQRTEFGGCISVPNYKIDHNKYKITKVIITFTTTYSPNRVSSLPLYLGMNDGSFMDLMKNGNTVNFSEKSISCTNRNVYGNYLPYGSPFSYTLNETQLERFQKYFYPNNTFYAYTNDKSFYEIGYSQNRANFEDFSLYVEYEPKAANFLILQSQLKIGSSDNQISINTLGEGFKYKLILELGKKTVETDFFDSQTINVSVPKDWGTEIPTTYRASGKLSLVTYLNDEQIDEPHTVPMDYVVPRYNFGNITINNKNSYYKRKEGSEESQKIFLKDLSEVSIDFKSEAAERYDSKIISKTITYYYWKETNGTMEESILFTEALKESNVLTLKESGTLVVEVIDSRQAKLLESYSYTVVKENLPSLEGLTMDRCLESGKYSNLGKNVRIQGTLNNGNLKLYVRNPNGEYIDQVGLVFVDTNSQPEEKPYWKTEGDRVSTDSSHYFKLAVSSSQYFTNEDLTAPAEMAYYLQINSSTYLIHFLNSGKGLGFGCAADAEKENEITVGWHSTFKEGLSLPQALNAESGGTGFNSILGLWNHISDLTHTEKNESYILNLGVSNLSAKSISIKPFVETEGEEEKTNFYPVYPMKIVTELPEVGVPGVVYLLKK